MKQIFAYLIISISTFVLACNSGNNTQTATATPISVGDYETVTYPGESDLAKATKKDAQGKILEEGDLLNGQKHGTWVTYQANLDNTITEIASYKNGIEHGVKIFMKNGKPTEKIYYANGLIHGIREQYATTNKVTLRANYVQGKLNGESKKFYNDGKLLEESTYKNGLLDGTSKYYDQEGNLKFEYKYKNGKKVE